MARPKPISASNPPKSRGNRGAKDEGLLVVEQDEAPKKTPAKRAVSQPTLVEKSPTLKPEEEGDTKKLPSARKSSRTSSFGEE